MKILVVGGAGYIGLHKVRMTKLRILFRGIKHSLELTGIGKYSGEMAESH